MVFAPTERFQVCAETVLATNSKRSVILFIILLVKWPCVWFLPSLKSKIRINNAISINKIKRI